MDKKLSFTIQEAATFLGFKSTHNLSEKARRGEIPGAFKIANRWMFLVDELEKLARNFYKKLRSENAGKDSNVG